MPRKPQADPEFGSDSFLDVVANLVGILIILVVVAGLRIQHAPAQAAQQTPELDLTQPRAAVSSLDEESRRLAGQAIDLDQEAAARLRQQEQLAAALAAARNELDTRRSQLSEQERQSLDAQHNLLSAQALAEQLEQELSQTSATKKTMKVESYPTPLARTVDGKEVHFQLRAGRIACIPLEELLVKLKADAPSQFWKLKDLPEATATVGPIDGFRLRYTFQRIDVPLEDQLAGRRMVSSVAQLSQWTLVPSDNLLGETLEEALLPKSLFREALTKQRGRNTTVTLWTYPDSFNEFRQLKKELYLLGFPIAGRPMPPDAPIGGSPHGSKSAAQ
jgi:hypothetical protein